MPTISKSKYKNTRLAGCDKMVIKGIYATNYFLSVFLAWYLAVMTKKIFFIIFLSIIKSFFDHTPGVIYRIS